MCVCEDPVFVFSSYVVFDCIQFLWVSLHKVNTSIVGLTKIFGGFFLPKVSVLHLELYTNIHIVAYS